MSYEYEDEYDNRKRHENYRREEVYNQLIPVQRKKIDKSKTFIIRFRVIASLLSLLVSFVFGWVIGHSFEYGFIGLFFGFILMIVFIIIAPFLPSGNVYRLFCKWCKDSNAQWSDLRRILSDN